MSLSIGKRKLEDLLVLGGRGEAEEGRQSSSANDLPSISLRSDVEEGDGSVDRMMEA